MRVGQRAGAVVALLAVVSAVGHLAPAAHGGGVGGGETTSTPPPTTVAPTTRPPITVPRTVPTLPARPTTAPPQTATTAPLTTEVTEEDDEPDASATTIALIVGLILAVLLVLLVVFLIRRRQNRDAWGDQARAIVSEGQRIMSAVVRGLGTMGQPAAAAHTWSEVDSDGADMHRRLRALVQGAPDQQSAAAATRTDQALQALRSAVESDRALRLGPPAPTGEQLGYSEAVLREQAAAFEHALEDLDAVVREGR